VSAQPGHDSAERTSQADLAGEGAPARPWWRRTPRVGVDGFRVVRRGYDPVQVHQLQQQVAAQTSILIADRDAALAQAAQLSQDLDSARGRIEQLCAQLPRVSAPDTLESFAERLEVIGRLAREEHAELRAECVADTAALITAAQPDLPPTSAAADPTASDEHPRDPADPDRSPVDRQRPDPTGPAALENDLGHDREQRRARRAAAAQQALLDEAAAERREKAQDQLRMELALRCRETLTQLAAQHVQAVHTAELVLAQAHDTARRIVAQAQREVEQMHQVRAQLADELRSSRTLLEEVFARNQPTALTTDTTTAATSTAAPSDVTSAASGRVASPPDLPDPPDDLPSHPSALGRMGGDNGGDGTAAQPAAPTSAGAAR
jgi:hypothetical protein